MRNISQPNLRNKIKNKLLRLQKYTDKDIMFVKTLIIGICITGIIIIIGWNLYEENNQNNLPPVENSKVIHPQQKAKPSQNKKRIGKTVNIPGPPDTFYQIIIDNNLFRPLGWQPETPQPKFMLIGTAIAKNTTQHTKAFIVERQSGQLHIVQVNDRMGEQLVKRIEAKQVILQGVDQEITLQLEHAPFF